MLETPTTPPVKGKKAIMRGRMRSVRAIAPDINPSNGGRVYKCRECSLLFTPEDARAGVYRIDSRTCVRCFVRSRAESLDVVLPDCFGVSYDGSNSLCSERCTVRSACLIELSEGVYSEKPFAERQGRRQTYRSHLVRILRAIGRPAHVLDIAPVLERETGGKFKVDPTGCWIENLKRVCKTAPEVIALGSQFYVWEGCWDVARDGGVPGCSNNRAYRETLGHVSVEEILSRLEADEEVT